MSGKINSFHSIFGEDKHFSDSEEPSILSKIYCLDSQDCHIMTRQDFNRVRKSLHTHISALKGFIVGLAFDQDAKSFLSLYPALVEMFRQGVIPLNIGDHRGTPQCWIQDALESLNIAAIVCDQSCLDMFDNDIFDIRTGVGNEDIFILTKKKKEEEVTKLDEDIAYVAQTSGTTGKRKSVFVTWASIGSNILCLLYTSPSPRDS